MGQVNRRDFIRSAAIAAVSAPLLPNGAYASKKRATVFVVHGKNVKKMLAAGLSKLGGWQSFVKKGKKATLKVNVSWPSLPEQGGNTDPILTEQCVASCLAAGASEVVVPENIIGHSPKAFSMSGIEAAVKRSGGKIYDAVEDKHYRDVEIPKGKALKKESVIKDVLDTGCLINIPVAKSHGGTVLTISMKNWMGAVKGRKDWHSNDLHQCIADFSTFIKPSLVIVDATRIMLTNGPRGPGEMAHPNQLIFSLDPVAADAYAATLFDRKPFDIKYIEIAHGLGIGCGNLDDVEIVHVKKI